VLSAQQLSRAFGAQVVLRELDLRLVPRMRLGVVGPNGAGKTTLLELLVGAATPDAGRVTRDAGCTIGYARQDATAVRGQRVLDAVVSAADDVVETEQRLRDLEHEIAATAPGSAQDALLARYGTLQDRFANAAGYGLEARARKVLAGLGFADAHMAADVATLSGGWMMRVTLARLLLTTPDVLLLDEPTNHLDFAAGDWLAAYLRAYDGAVVVVSHDRWLLDEVVTHVLELDGRGGHALYTGNYTAFVEQRRARREQQAAAAAAQAREIARVEQFVDRFRAKASKASQVQSRIKALDRMERIEAPDDRRARLRLSLPTPPRSGREVLSLHGVDKRYGDTVVLTATDLVIERGDTVAVVGPNGAGKTTLLRLAAGLEQPDAGTCTRGHNVTPAYFAQHHADTLDAGRTVLEEVDAALADRTANPRAVLGAFGFPGDTVDKRTADCSGGERARVALARLVGGPANLLCLDEPTNHLDIDSRELLTDALRAYEGTVLLVTHDRALVRAVADRICAVGDGRAALRDGDLDDYLADRAGDRHADATGPTDRGEGGDASSPARTDRREQRRAAAEQRRRTQHLRARIAEAEAELEAAESRVAELERAMADPATYEDAEAARELTLAHGLGRERVATAEQRWEQLVEQLESASGQAPA
jgi:ATP-binding cassette subfamily F protein 3